MIMHVGGNIPLKPLKEENKMAKKGKKYQEAIAKEKGLSIIQLENIIDRLELTLKSEGL